MMRIKIPRPEPSSKIFLSLKRRELLQIKCERTNEEGQGVNPVDFEGNTIILLIITKKEKKKE